MLYINTGFPCYLQNLENLGFCHLKKKYWNFNSKPRKKLVIWFFKILFQNVVYKKKSDLHLCYIYMSTWQWSWLWRMNLLTTISELCHKCLGLDAHTGGHIETTKCWYNSHQIQCKPEGLLIMPTSKQLSHNRQVRNKWGLTAQRQSGEYE